MSGYTCVWEFTIALEHEAEFERHYGASGTWAQLFGASAGYIGTLLLKDASITGRYITVDRWVDEQAYLQFRSVFGQQYAQLDERCESLTLSEKRLGEFSESAT